MREHITLIKFFIAGIIGSSECTYGGIISGWDLYRRPNSFSGSYRESSYCIGVESTTFRTITYGVRDKMFALTLECKDQTFDKMLIFFMQKGLSKNG